MTATPTFEEAQAQAATVERKIQEFAEFARANVRNTLRKVPLESILSTLPSPTTLNKPHEQPALTLHYWQSYSHYSGIAFNTTPLGRELEVQVWQQNGVTHLDVYYITGVQQKTFWGIEFKKRAGPLQKLYNELVQKLRRTTSLK